jgi:hypothetical protein
MMNVEQKFLRIKADEYEGLYILFCFVVESRDFSLALHSLHFSGALDFNRDERLAGAYLRLSAKVPLPW